MDQFNKEYDTSTTGTAAHIGVNYGCQHKLPCGYCTLLNRACPMQGNTIVEPTWKLPDITCTSTPPTASFTEIKG